jgi:tetratricopeptide (TPR) repeat protein
MSEGRPSWSDRVERLGVPLILLDHNNQFAAEATLLAEPRWRCVFFDEVASVFLDGRRNDLEAPYPTIDFAARHFLARPEERAARGLAEAFSESRGYAGVGAALAARETATWSQRAPILLLAGARAREALAIRSNEAKVWMTLGSALWSLSEDLAPGPAGPAQAWDAARGLAVAEAIYACRRTIALEPETAEVRATLLTMKSYFNSAGMIDAGDWADELLEQHAGSAAAPDAHAPRLAAALAVSLPPGAGTDLLSELFEDRLRHGRVLAAIELVRQAEARGIVLPWKLADRVAITHLSLGEPAQARKYWEQAHAPPSTALRLARIAQAELALTNIDAAEKSFRAALLLDQRLGEAWFGLALLELQLGRADATLADCNQGLACTLTEPEREALGKFKTLVDPFASSGRGSDRGSP